MMLVGLLLGGTLGLQVGATDDGFTVAWGPTPPVALVVDGPVVKVPTPAGTLRARARTTSFGVALERKLKGATLTETLFRDGDALIVAIEANVPGREVVILRRVYRLAAASSATPSTTPAP
ncbi:MAG: hypothetical protein Q8P18_26925 [Pseudomonadota bacterium]|nr:hypothetical protein [Pseudomonadota bacterium]